MTIDLPQRPTRPNLSVRPVKPDGTWTDAWLKYWAALAAYEAQLDAALRAATP